MATKKTTKTAPEVTSAKATKVSTKETKASTKTPKETKVATKATPQTPVEPKAKAERDRWGNRVGTQAAQINAVMGSKPKKVKAIAEETQLDAGRVRNHMTYLVERGHLTQTEDGYVVKAAK